jgi:hypothetical protein
MCGRSDQSQVGQVTGLDPERIRHVVSEMYAVILAAAFVVLITIDKDPILFYAKTWQTLWLHLLPFAFLWIEWFWTEHFFMPGDSTSQGKLLLNTFVHIAQLWCICFCCVFFIRGDSFSQLPYNEFQFWFASYLFCVIFWGYLNRKPVEAAFNLINVYIFSLFVVIWRLNEQFKLQFDNQLRNAIIGYMVFCILFRVVFVVVRNSRWLQRFRAILSETPAWPI